MKRVECLEKILEEEEYDCPGFFVKNADFVS